MSFYSSILSKTASLLSATNRGFMPRPSLFGGLQHNQLLSFWSILGNVRAKHSIKTNRSAYKRFRVKGNGQLKRWALSSENSIKGYGQQSDLARFSFFLKMFAFYFNLCFNRHFPIIWTRFQKQSGNVPQHWTQRPEASYEAESVHGHCRAENWETNAYVDRGLIIKTNYHLSVL